METEKLIRRLVIASSLFILCLVVFFGSFHVVPPGHRGVRVMFGQVTTEELTEGLKLKWPLVSSIHDQSIKQEAQTSTTDCFSKDLQTVKIKYSVLFKIPSDKVVPLYRDYSGDVFSSLIDARVQEALKQN